MNDEEIISTIGKKISFTAVRKKHKSEQKQFIKVTNDLAEKIKQLVPTDNNLSLLHLNMFFLEYHFDELEDLTLCNIDFNFIGMTEFRLQTKNKSSITNSLQRYDIEKFNYWLHLQASQQAT